jgi:hypothetical protein
MQLAPRLIKTFSHADTQTFSSSDLLAAQDWICSE